MKHFIIVGSILVIVWVLVAAAIWASELFRLRKRKDEEKPEIPKGYKRWIPNDEENERMRE